MSFKIARHGQGPVQSMGPGIEATFPYQAGRGMQQFMQLSDYILTNASP